MNRIYHIPNVRRKKESEFFYFIKKQFPDLIHLRENYYINSDYLNNNLIETEIIINKLKTDLKLPNKRKERCIDILKNLPDKLKIAISSKDLTFDFVIFFDENVYFIEFHENQHRQLKVSRKSYIYDIDDNVYFIPRYLQRLLRDVWRFKFCRPFIIVWFDWFEFNKGKFKLELKDGIHEYFIKDEFSFSSFLS